VSESESEVASATNREFVEFNCYPFKAKDLADTPSEKREREERVRRERQRVRKRERERREKGERRYV